MPKATVIPVTRDEAVDINTYILICCRPVVIRRSFRLPRPFPTRDFSLQQLNRSLAQVSKTATAMSVIENLPPET